MNKPITLVIEETKTKLADVINTSGLPPFVIEPMLSTFLQEAHVASKMKLKSFNMNSLLQKNRKNRKNRMKMLKRMNLKVKGGDSNEISFRKGI